MRYFLALAVMLPFSAFAGSQSRDCQTADQAIVMGAGNSTNQVQIKFIDSNGKAGTYTAPVRIMPEFDYNTEQNDQTITAVPVSAEKIVSKNHQVMHVVHKDGTQCDGREQWDDHSTQSYVLTGKDGSTLATELVNGKVKYLTADGYIVAQFQCRNYGVTSPGGCFADDGDKVTWRKED